MTGSVWFDPSVIAAYIAVASGGMGWVVSRVVGRFLKSDQETAAALGAQLTGWVSLVQALEGRIEVLERENARCEKEVALHRREIEMLKRRR